MTATSLLKAAVVLLMAAAISPAAEARKVRVGPSKLGARQVEATADVAPRTDTVACPEGAIRCSGYEKPNQAAKETFFLTNLTPDSLEVEGVMLTLEYSDMQGRQLHRRRATVKTNLPPGQTRSAAIATWDPNRAFHYFRSQAPSRRRSTPYRVSARVDSLIIVRR